MVEALLKDFEGKLEKAVEILHDDLATIRTGRATSGMIEKVVLKVYGGTQSLRVEELATIGTEDSQTLVVMPFDPSIIEEIEKGLREANLGLSVSPIDGRLRLKIPQLTEEQREEYVKLAQRKVEGGHIMVRQIRKEAMQNIKKQFDAEEISEDGKFKLEKEIQELVDKIMEKIKALGEQKEQEIRSI